MNKIKDFGNFVNENIKKEEINENIFSDIISAGSGLEPIMQAAYYMGLAVEAFAVGGIVSSVGGVVISALKNSILGDRGKEFANKIKVLGEKGASLFKSKQKDDNFVKEVDMVTDEYEDVLNDLKNGELGEDGKKFAENIEKAKNK